MTLFHVRLLHTHVHICGHNCVALETQGDGRKHCASKQGQGGLRSGRTNYHNSVLNLRFNDSLQVKFEHAFKWMIKTLRLFGFISETLR